MHVLAEEWPLLSFTLLTQLAVGTYLFLVIIRTLTKNGDKKITINATKKGMFFIGPVMVVALLLSAFHLGDPLGAYRSLGNLGSSWLSREIVFAGLFFGLWFVSYYLDRKGAWNQILGWVNSIVGLAAIYSMASIYATSIKPAWTDVNTYIAFFGTTILFGAVASILLIALSKEEKPKQLSGILKGIGLIGLAAIIIQLIYLPVYVAGLSVNGGLAGAESASLITGTYAVSTMIRWILSIAGLVILGIALYRKMESKTQYTYYYTTALLLVVVGEFLGRFIFYATGVPIIVG
ncbi:DmsC/YnfH family molybdoenzyme membrane anchor subunit [Bacillus sp. B15-48]|uniref:dimethyl sulfoxide reductase anchor subunit family protein n=1 Tax=Bacillus sp. B15-48 TaxID=1548601 RepID=UPI00193F192C|nr:DmsC/YnfH family molybdoenzyme membrane anchor subunit [Bacillus sp. B15-48]MBM4763510.1 DMSO reductase [Bacillus sp. B15-48]